MKSSIISAAFFAIIACSLIILTVSQPAPNYRPIIGIVTVPSEYPDQYSPLDYSYLPASYVKFAESGGARVVPIQYDLPLANLTTLFGYLNGFVFTGGAQDLTIGNSSNLTQYATTINTILQWSIEATLNGSYTPVWGTCMGFQYISYLISNDYNVVINMPGISDVALELQWNTTNYPQSRTFNGFPSDLYTDVTTEDLVYFDADYTTDPAAWSTNANLSEWLVPVAYSTNAEGTQFVSYIEGAVVNGSAIPIYASQFHPEKVTFEWDNITNIPHSFDAIRVEQWLANFFVNETRSNHNQFPNETYAAQFVIENFNTTILVESQFQQIYFFQNVNFTGTDQTNNVNPSLLAYLAKSNSAEEL
jgi:hypothetical protein